MKKMIIAVLALVFIVMTVVIFSRTRVNDEEIRIGAILPLTGDLASYGQNAKDGK